MAVILRSLLAGPDGVYQAGARATFSPEFERALVEGGYAVFDKVQERGEAAVMPRRETAVMPRLKKRAAP